MAPGRADEPEPQPNVLRLPPPAAAELPPGDPARILALRREALSARVAEARALGEQRLSEARAARAAALVAELEARLRAALAERARVRRDAAEREAEIVALRRRLDETEARLADHQRALAESRAALAARDAAIAERDAALAEWAAALADRDAGGAAPALRTELARARAQRERALEQLGRRSRQLEELRASRAYGVLRVLWRIHAAVGRPLRRRGA